MGGQKGIAFFYKFFSKKVNLTCVTTTGNEIIFAEGYRVLPIISENKLRYINIFYFFILRKVIRDSQISHLIIEHPYYGWLGILLKWFCKVKLIVHSHNIESLRFKSTGKWWWGILWHYEKWVHKKADHNFFIQDNDRGYAIKNYKLNAEKCTTITYGFELIEAPALADKQSARREICEIHGISDTDKILLFNGTLDYKPNLDALDVILKKINPLLLANKNYKYKFVICGSKLPSSYNALIEYNEKNIIYAGFVNDINLYFKGAGIFINPVIDGGGIKTKVVEALGYNLSVVSTQSGAIGIPVEITGKKLFIVNDNNWENFTNHILSVNADEQIPGKFFSHFYWGTLAEKAFEAIKNINSG
jgi:polysaccharide biosynthesis protein PslH